MNNLLQGKKELLAWVGVAVFSSLALIVPSFTYGQAGPPAAIFIEQAPETNFPVVPPGTKNVQIAKYKITTPISTYASISGFTIRMGERGSDFENLKLQWGTEGQFGPTQKTLQSNSNYTFSSTPRRIVANSTVYLYAYADVLSSARSGVDKQLTLVTGCNAVNASNKIIFCTSAAGQDIKVAGGGSSLTISLNRSFSPKTQQVMMGSTGVALGVLQFTETSNIESVKITDLTILDSVNPVQAKASFFNLTLYDPATLAALATAGVPTYNAALNLYSYSFHFAQPVMVPQAGSISMVLKGDIASYVSSGATDNSVHVFQMAGDSITAFGGTSNAPVTNVRTSDARIDPIRVLRSQLTASAQPRGTTINRPLSPGDDLGILTFSANAAGTVNLQSVAVTFSGTALPQGSLPVSLVNQNGVSLNTVVSLTSPRAFFRWPTDGYSINAGNSVGFIVRVDSTRIAGCGVKCTPSLSAAIANASDVRYADGLDRGATSDLILLPQSIPMRINSVAYVPGSGNNTTSIKSSATFSSDDMAIALQNMRNTLEGLRNTVQSSNQSLLPPQTANILENMKAVLENIRNSLAQ